MDLDLGLCEVHGGPRRPHCHLHVGLQEAADTLRQLLRREAGFRSLVPEDIHATSAEAPLGVDPARFVCFRQGLGFLLLRFLIEGLASKPTSFVVGGQQTTGFWAYTRKVLSVCHGITFPAAGQWPCDAFGSQAGNTDSFETLRHHKLLGPVVHVRPDVSVSSLHDSRAAKGACAVFADRAWFKNS